MPQAVARPALHRSGQEHARRQPEQTVLYQVVSTYWPEFAERAQEHGGLPKFVSREALDYLDCGRLEKGCIEVACTRCGFTHVVAFSCKRRGFCPSCCGRRMNDTAAFLVDRVLPSHSIRQWVCTLPFSLRYVLGYHAGLCGAIVDAFAKELMKSYQRRGKRELGLRSRTQAKTGTVTFVQRFDSALRLSPHMHVLTLDGVYVRGEAGALEFHALAEPTRQEVLEVASRTAARAERVLRRQGRSLGEGEGAVHDELSDAEPVLSSCYRAATSGQQLLGDESGQPVLRVIVPARSRQVQAGKLVAEASGFNVHAQRVVDGRDRAHFVLPASITTATPASRWSGPSRQLGRSFRPLCC